MSTKEEALKYIQSLALQKAITKDELIEAFDSGSSVKQDTIFTKQLGVAEISYYIGGAIVFLGIAILLGQNWSTLSFVTKLLATLGSGIAAYLVGVLFSRNEQTETVGTAFYLISALVTPIGLFVVYNNAGYDFFDHSAQSMISGIMFVTYLLSLLAFRKHIFTLFSILFGTWFYFSLTNWLVDGSILFDNFEFYLYRVLAAGVAYIFLGYAFSKDERAPLNSFLYGFGVLGVLGSTLVLGGWAPNQNVFWELIYPALVFAALFMSVHIKSRASLAWGTLFLMLYILKITAQYFSAGLGWPLALVIAGLAMIAVAYMSVTVKNKYLSSQ